MVPYADTLMGIKSISSDEPGPLYGVYMYVNDIFRCTGYPSPYSSTNNKYDSDLNSKKL